MRKGGARQKCGRTETSAPQCTKAGETHKNNPGGKRPQERRQNKEQGLAKCLPWLSVAVTWLQLTQHPVGPPGPRGAWSSQPSCSQTLNFDCKCQHTDPFLPQVGLRISETTSKSSDYIMCLDITSASVQFDLQPSVQLTCQMACRRRQHIHTPGV